MSSKFTIKIKTHIAVQNHDGKQVRIQCPAGRVAYNSTLSGLNATLVTKGLILSCEAHSYDDAADLIASRLEALFESLDRINAITFADGAFELVRNRIGVEGSGGDWTLRNPSGALSCLKGSNGIVGYYPNPYKAIWKAVERTLFASGETVAYADLRAMVLMVADELTADIKIEVAR